MPLALQKKGVRAILKSGRTIEQLADGIECDPGRLAATVARFNMHAAQGQDPDFHRGEAAYDKMYGDPRQKPNPSLRPLNRGPFYAMPIYPGDIGTNGGLRTNAKAQVVAEDGGVIQGLYAVGNNAASAMGESYPGAGVTLGPAMTFGYLAARAMTGSND
jgi:3-oxosteroid 1-dehydrogenase